MPLHIDHGQVIQVDIAPVAHEQMEVQIIESEEKPEETTAEVQPEYNKLSYLDKNCSCIIYIKNRGVDIQGDAIDLIPNTYDRSVLKQGDVVLLNYHNGSVGHAAYIEAVFPGGIYISEANYKRCKYTERMIEWTDPHIRGYIHY